jgi:hypothetical protein
VAFKPKDAIDAARNIWSGPRMAESRRLNYIASAVSPARSYSESMQQPWGVMPSAPTVEMPRDAPQVMKNLAWKSRTNFLPLILDAFAQQIKADGYIEANGTPSKAWRYWQHNGLDARQTGIHRSALQFGAAYATILPGDIAPAIEGFSPRRMTAIYADPHIDDWPMLALDVNGPMLRLFDEEGIYRIGLENYPISGLGAYQVPQPPAADWHFIDFSPHTMGFTPVARFRDRMLLDGEEVFGIIEPLIDIQKRVDETTFGMMVAQYYQAFKQRYITGWIAKSEEEYLKTSTANVWMFEDDTVKVGSLEAGDMAPYITSKDSALTDMAAIAQLPASALGAQSGTPRNVGAEAVASIDAGKDRKAGEIRTSLGETWELVLRTAAALDGDQQAAEDTSSQLRWRDMTTTSPGAIVDALGKMNAMLGVPAEMLWERIPGWTDQDQVRAIEIIKSGDSLDKLMVTLSKPQGGVPADNPGGQQQSEVGNQTVQPPIAAGLGGSA